MKTTGNNDVFTLITGASQGLGKEFAIEFARRHQNLILVALPGGNLQQFCDELTYQYGIRTFSFECDLTNEKALDDLAGFIRENFAVNQLINNAGIGGTMRFEDASCEYLDKIIHLNIRATTMLTRLMLPELRLHKKALIMNIASIAAFGPIPYKTIYPASKAFIYSFSRSLSKELKGTGIKVVVVNPGQFSTNSDVACRIINQGFIGKIGLLTARNIAFIAISSAEHGKEVVVPGFLNKMNQRLIRWIPEFIRLNLLELIFRRELLKPVVFNKPSMQVA
jgi:short-subunit dehydrogenase